MRRPLPVLLILVTALSGCGSALQDSVLGSADGTTAPKVKCPGSHEGFFVCMSSSSKISDSALAETMAQALTDLATLVNSTTFQSKVTASFTSGQSIAGDLSATDYIVDIQGYCNASDDALAKAPVGDSSIDYNECRVERDASGQYDVAQVAGILLHEIAHNIGYTHPDVNPSRLTVPYYLGDLAEADLASASGPTATAASAASNASAPSPRSRRHSGLGY